MSVPTRLEDISLPKDAFWTFLHKRNKSQYPKDKWLFNHPSNWKKCNRCGNCCKDFEQLRLKFVPKIPKIYDLIQAHFEGKLWQTISIESEAHWFWIVTNGLDNKQIDRIKKKILITKSIPCPFWYQEKNISKFSLCLIYDRRPDGCFQFPEYSREVLEFKCIDLK